MKRNGALFSREGQRKYLTWSEREAFFQAVKKCPDPRKRAFCLTLFYTGCRISEALEITGNRFDVSEGIIVFRTLKRRDKNHYRIVPIPSSLAELLDTVSKGGAKRESLLWGFTRPTGYRLIKHYMQLAAIEGIRACPKGLRHSFAVACISRGVPVTTLQRWMGHARLETTAIYLDLIGEEDRKQAAKIWKTS